MATRKQARKQTLVQVLALLIAVVVIVVAVVLFQSWSNNRPGAHPKDIRVTATVGDESIEVAPYLVCEPGTECPEGEDRKSTRLNSSHVSISYAVFCLK